MSLTTSKPWTGYLCFAALSLLTLLVYWPGLHGGYIFDDFPNIVDNTALHVTALESDELIRAALSSPSSQIKRPIASLSFAMNHALTGLSPFAMKLTNLLIHLANGALLFLIGKALLLRAWASTPGAAEKAVWTSALMAGGWMLLPINLTGVLYVVQRMESLAQLFVLLGLLGYLHGRRRMESAPSTGLALCALWLIGATALGVLTKESAVLLPLYAALMEFFLLGGLRRGAPERTRMMVLFGAVLIVPMIIGLWWLSPRILGTSSWMRRDFTLYERLLTEGRVVLSYIGWTLIPLPKWLSFYHDHYAISRGWLSPWTTLASAGALTIIASAAWLLRKRAPLIALGIAWYFAAHVLTATVLPLELVFEHRNYFASFGLLLAIVPLVIRPAGAAVVGQSMRAPQLARIGPLIVVAFITLWAGFTAMSARIWSSPLRLGIELEARAPESFRARYELGRTYLILSDEDPSSPFFSLAQKSFESAILTDLTASILPEQALIYMNARVRQPFDPAWWASLLAKLRAHAPSAEDDGALLSLTRCARSKRCELPQDNMIETYLAALDHPRPSARLLAAYADYAWNVLKDRDLAIRLSLDAIQTSPRDAVYRITLIKMYLVTGEADLAQAQIDLLRTFPGWGDTETIVSALEEKTDQPSASDVQ